MIETNLGVRGAKRTSFSKANLRELAIKVCNENVDVKDADQLRDLLIRAVHAAREDGDEGYVETCILHACTNTITALTRENPPEHVKQERREEREKVKRETRAAMSKNLEVAVERRARRIFLDTLFGDKMARDLTGVQMTAHAKKMGKEAAGWIKVGKAAGKKFIGEVFTETDIRKLMR